LHTVYQGLARGPKVAPGGVVARIWKGLAGVWVDRRGRARVEVFRIGRVEPLPDEAGTDHLAVLVRDQTSVGLVVKGHLTEAGDGKRIDDARDETEDKGEPDGSDDLAGN